MRFGGNLATPEARNPDLRARGPSLLFSRFFKHSTFVPVDRKGPRVRPELPVSVGSERHLGRGTPNAIIEFLNGHLLQKVMFGS